MNPIKAITNYAEIKVKVYWTTYNNWT